MVLAADAGMHLIAREVDQSEAARARSCLERAIVSQYDKLGTAMALPPPTDLFENYLSNLGPSPTSVYDPLLATDRASPGSDRTIIINWNNSSFTGDPRNDPTSIVRDLYPVVSPQPGAVSLHMDSHLLSTILRLDCVDDLKIMALPLAGDKSMAPGKRGSSLVLSWRPRLPGHVAITQWAPIIGLMIGGLIGLFVIVIWSGIAISRRLEWRATHDSLTGLLNRAAFEAELNRLLSSGFEVAIGMADLNGFKKINDLHGHSVGDELLRSVAAEFLVAAEAGDFVARLGGDEFAWISPCLSAAQRLKSKLTMRLDHPLSAGQLKLTIKVAVGLALSTSKTNAVRLLEMADNELYRHKTQLS